MSNWLTATFPSAPNDLLIRLSNEGLELQECYPSLGPVPTAFGSTCGCFASFIHCDLGLKCPNIPDFSSVCALRDLLASCRGQGPGCPAHELIMNIGHGTCTICGMGQGLLLDLPRFRKSSRWKSHLCAGTLFTQSTTKLWSALGLPKRQGNSQVSPASSADATKPSQG